MSMFATMTLAGLTLIFGLAVGIIGTVWVRQAKHADQQLEQDAIVNEQRELLNQKEVALAQALSKVVELSERSRDTEAQLVHAKKALAQCQVVIANGNHVTGEIILGQRKNGAN